MVLSNSFGSVSDDITSPSEDQEGKPNPVAADFQPEFDHHSPADSQDEGVQGAEGADGAQGAEEAEGADGTQGAEEEDGAEGAEGADGAEGAERANGTQGGTDGFILGGFLPSTLGTVFGGIAGSSYRPYPPLSNQYFNCYSRYPGKISMHFSTYVLDSYNYYN